MNSMPLQNNLILGVIWADYVIVIMVDEINLTQNQILIFMLCTNDAT